MKAYATKLQGAIGLKERNTRKSGKILASLLKLDVSSSFTPSIGQVENAIADSNFSQIVSLHFEAQRQASHKNFEKSYESQKEMVKTFMTTMYGEDSTYWLVPTLHTVIGDALILARRTDDRCAEINGFREHKFVEDCISSLVREAFTATLVVKSEKKAKKMGALFLAVCMIRSYFGMNTLRQATLIVNNVSKMILTGKTTLANFPKSHSVPYQYYAGRLQIVAGRYDEAEDTLMFALRNCPVDILTNRRQILRVLIPCKMVRGVLPTLTLLHEHNLKQFEDISRAVRTGDVRLYNKSINAYRAKFVSMGTYFLMERLRYLVYRMMFKRVYLIRMSELPADSKKRNRMRIQDLVSVLETCGGETKTCDEVECILANLIFRKQMKGYISHAHSLVVMSKENPFPSSLDWSYS
jgi:nuclear mRNA export protein PCID2/THP1